MQEELQLHHLPRYEKKRLVKGWHTAQTSSNASPSVPNDEPNEADRIARSGSIRSLFAPPPGALAYESQGTETWRSTSNSIDDWVAGQDDLHNPQDEKLPKTVGQVKHSYRARARKQEARDTSKAIQKREMILEFRRGTRWRDREPMAKAKAKAQQPATLQEDTNNDESEVSEAADPSKDKFSGELQLLDLPVDEVVTNATYRDEVLRRIRHQLSNGGEVLLQSDCASLNELVKSTRLMLQTLCTQSLAYCVRDQNVVPETLSQLQSTTRLALRLIPRHQPM